MVPVTGVQIPPPQPEPRSSVRGVCEHVFVARAKPTIPISERDLCWLAGLLEGEGSFIAGPPSAPRTPAVVLSMVDRDVVARAADLLDASVNVVPSRREGAGGDSVRQVAERLGTSIWCIADLRIGRTHAHLPRPAG